MVLNSRIIPKIMILPLLPANPTHPDKYSEHNPQSFIMKSWFLLQVLFYAWILTFILYILTCNAFLPLNLSLPLSNIFVDFPRLTPRSYFGSEIGSSRSNCKILWNMKISFKLCVYIYKQSYLKLEKQYKLLPYNDKWGCNSKVRAFILDLEARMIKTKSVNQY